MRRQPDPLRLKFVTAASTAARLRVAPRCTHCRPMIREPPHTNWGAWCAPSHSGRSMKSPHSTLRSMSTARGATATSALLILVTSGCAADRLSARALSAGRHGGSTTMLDRCAAAWATSLCVHGRPTLSRPASRFPAAASPVRGACRHGRSVRPPSTCRHGMASGPNLAFGLPALPAGQR